MRCLEENTLFEYVHDGLDGAARHAIGDHAASCDACRQLIAAAVQALPSEPGREAAEAAEAAEALTVDGRLGPDDLTHAPSPASGPASSVIDDSAIGRIIADKYRLVRLLGAGGMGRVHEAINTWTGRRVAVKELLGTISSDATAVARFTLEAQSASRIAHPNVVDILDLGQDPATGALFMVQELLTGETLRQRLIARGALAIDDALRVLTPALAALSIAHAAGVIHRDLKPENIFLASGSAGAEVTKLIDFGLSKQLRPAGAPALDGDGGVALTEHGRQLGTPYYMSPEQLRGEPDLDDRTDVWAIGVVLFEAVAGKRPFAGPTYHELVVQILKEPVPRLVDVMPTVPAAYSALIARALERDRTRRIAIRELRDGLDELARRPEVRTVPAGNPYRGLAAFDAACRGVFFGRDDEQAAVLDRVRRGGFVLVAGDSGVGKSSLVRASVLPALGDARVVSLAPGRRPLHALAVALAPVLAAGAAAGDAAVSALAAQLADDAAAVATRLAAALAGARLVVFVDQLEELLTLADAGDAALASTALWVLADAVPALRLIATVRSDHLGRLANLPGLGDEVTRALYLMKPLSPAGVREAIVGPARITGLRFESAALVDELADAATDSAGGLPLLQFALAALWDARDVERGMICAATLDALGGVAGALARHADGVLAALPARHQLRARYVLTALVADDGTRMRRTLGELAAGRSELGPSDGEGLHQVEDLHDVIEALVGGRLAIADAGTDGDTSYQLAHDALVERWATLRGWRGRAIERDAVRQRLARAAVDWAQRGRTRDALWTGRQLVEAAELIARRLPPGEAAFLTASRRLAHRRRNVLFAIGIGIPLLIGAGVVGARWVATARTRAAIAVQVAAADDAIRRGTAQQIAVDVARTQAFEAFDAQRRAAGEQAWDQVLERQAAVAASYRDAAEHYETALAYDAGDRRVREGYAALILLRARVAEQTHQLAERDELVHRMRTYDVDGSQRALWDAPGALTVASQPPGATVSVQALAETGERKPAAAPAALGPTPITHASLAAGAYIVTLTAPDRAPVRAPIVIRRGEQLALQIPLPAQVPAGYVYVPRGRFQYGSSDDEDMRRTMMNAQPLHDVTTPGYLIARHEVTFGDWLGYLRALPPAERARRLPHTPQTASAHAGAYLELSEPRPGSFRLTIQPTSQPYTADETQAIHYEARQAAADQRWQRMPVSGISWDDAVAYGAWLDRTRVLPGARPCDEHEWERAARGADARLFPHGDRLAPGDADLAETYGRQPAAFGPDEVGSHPASDSPFGVADLAGNAWEWVASVSGDERVAIRGGSWYHNPLAARANNREPAESELRAIVIGMRVCASWPPAAGQ